MRKLRGLSWASVGTLFIALTIALIAFPSTPSATAQGSQQGNVGTAMAQAPVMNSPQWLSTAPSLSGAQQSALKQAMINTHLPGPKRDVGGSNRPESAPAGTESSVGISSGALNDANSAADMVPLAPADQQIFRNIDFRATIAGAGGSMSSVMESSVGVGGRYAFYTGNWFAARSTNGGSTWTYVNPFADFATFCCDQIALYDGSRDTMFWYRQGLRDANSANIFKLSVSNDGGSTFCTYDVAPTNTNSAWTNQWWDYPHIQIGADFMYIATNVFNNADQWTRTVLLRFPLDSLDSCASFSYNYFETSSWFTVVPVQGTDHVVWFASNWPTTTPQNSRISIWRWDENSTSLSNTVKTVTAWNISNGSTCGSGTNNWLSRSDFRLKTGARYMIQNNNLKFPGRKVLGFWWNVAQNTAFPRPYIEGAAFYEDNLTQVAGNQGRPLFWNSTICFAYPSAAANSRGDLGLVLNNSSGTNNVPTLSYSIADDYVAAPPGWSLGTVRTSSALPSDGRWGDYNTVRVFEPSQRSWVAAGHYWSASGSSPVYFAFGRGRDIRSWQFWQNK